jgi:hypothetical protein
MEYHMDSVVQTEISDQLLIKLAREIAMGIRNLDSILENAGVGQELWATIQNNSRFQRLLQSASEEWNGVLNTHERVKLKSSAIIEEWLPEAFVRMHDRAESLGQKVELAKTISRLAGMGLDKASIEGAGEKFSLVINIGDGVEHKVSVERPTIDITPEPIA